MPNVLFAVSACLARSLVSVLQESRDLVKEWQPCVLHWASRLAEIHLMTLAPQFCASVRGMTSSATATALYGHCSTPAVPTLAQEVQRHCSICTCM